MTASRSKNSLNAFDAISIADRSYTFFSLKAAEQTLGDLSHLPCCMRILLENLLRYEDEKRVTIEDMRTIAAYHMLRKNIPVVSFAPSRLLITESEGVSVLTDLAALRDTASSEAPMVDLKTLNFPTDILVNPAPQTDNARQEIFSFLKWGEKAFSGLRLLPPNEANSALTDIVGLTDVVRMIEDPENATSTLVPDTVLGTDRALAIVNSLGVLGWTIDALEIEGLLLQQECLIQLPFVIGVRINGKPTKGASAVDIALSIANVFTQNKCTGKMVEFYGEGLDHLTVHDRALIASATLSSGATCALFPIDAQTLNYLALIGHSPSHLSLVEAYAKAQGLWREPHKRDEDRPLAFSLSLDVELDTIRPILIGPGESRPLQLTSALAENFTKRYPPENTRGSEPLAPVHHGDIIHASLGSTVDIDHPIELIKVALFAKKARNRGLKTKPWVRTSFIPSNPVIIEFLRQNNLLEGLASFGFEIGKPLPPINEQVVETVRKNKFTVCSLSSEVHSTELAQEDINAARYICSPCMVLAYSITGTILTDVLIKPLGLSDEAKSVLYKDLLPTSAEIAALLEAMPLASSYQSFRQNLFHGSPAWQSISVEPSQLYSWNNNSLIIKRPPFLPEEPLSPTKLKNISAATVFAIFGDDIPASYLAPHGQISMQSPAGYYLAAHGQPPESDLSFSSRTGNYEVMARGAFMHPALTNHLIKDQTDRTGLTLYIPTQNLLSYFDAAERYAAENKPLIVVAGTNFGYGENREWAAKAFRLLGIRAVLAQSFAPSFALDLARVGVLPLQIKTGIALSDFKFDGKETTNLSGIPQIDQPPGEVMITVERPDGVERYMVRCCINSLDEIDMLRYGSLWALALRGLISLAV